MVAENPICGLPLGQSTKPAPDLVAAIAVALADAEFLAMANRLAEKSVELIRLAGAQQIVQSTVASCLNADDRPAALLQLALDRMVVGIEIAKTELERSERRLAAHRQAAQ